MNAHLLERVCHSHVNGVTETTSTAAIAYVDSAPHGGTLQRLRYSMHTFCAVSSISTASSLFRIDAITSLGSSSQFRVVSFFLYTFLVWFFFEGEEEEEGAPFSSILSLEVFSDLGFLEIGIFPFDFDFGQWSGNEISKDMFGTLNVDYNRNCNLYYKE